MPILFTNRVENVLHVVVVMLKGALGRILGFEDMSVRYPGTTYLAKYDVQLVVKTVETLFVYCDVLEHVVVGDVCNNSKI